ncbi:MAG TPA: hypothetical protein VEA69_11850 [Tepidisphaeraceae bacterium]|nr:hypothetical protein [Tepidisphaeraceae bacterium]
MSGLPFPVGEAVEVIVIERSDSGGTPEHRAPERWRTLAGTVVKYADPTGPVGVDDWDALR